ncbi:MAG: hypothetical protein ABI949_14300 [Ilumatobacteraceae bacterium]
MTRTDRSWFVGAWRRRSICVPGSEPTEPCEAWWLQAGEAFVDVRVATVGMAENDLPYSSTRAFAGRFEIVDDGVRWHVEIDSDGPVPRSDGSASTSLSISPGDPLLMIEDAPGRFREEWVQHSPAGEVQFTRAANLVSVRVGDVYGLVTLTDGSVLGRIWDGQRMIQVGP